MSAQVRAFVRFLPAVGGLLVALAFGAASAQAVRFAPANANFAGTGTEDFKYGSVTYTCTVSWTANTDPYGVLRFTKGVTTGGGSASDLCKETVFKSLPWTTTAKTLTTEEIAYPTWQVPGMPTCGATSKLLGSFNNSTHTAFYNAAITGTCIYHTQITFPGLTIVP